MSEEQKINEAAAEAVETQAPAEVQKPSQPSASDLLSAEVGEIKVRKA